MLLLSCQVDFLLFVLDFFHVRSLQVGDFAVELIQKTVKIKANN